MKSTQDTSRKHIIAVDMPVDDRWSFARHLSREAGVPFTVVSADGRAHVSRWRRIIVYVTMALRLFARRRRIEVLVCWQQFFGLIFASLCQTFGVKKRVHLIVMTFIYRPKAGAVGRFYRWWVRRTLTGGYIDRVLVYSSHEPSFYARELGVNADLFRFVPLGIDDEPLQLADDRGYWFSTGKSNRDYDFLVGALAGTAHRLVIACDTLPQPAAPNVTVHHDAFGDDMLRLMNSAHGVIIALDDQHVSSGQLVMLQAMMLGKPLIVTRSDAITDYVEDGSNALVIDKDPEALLAAIDRLNSDRDLYTRMSAAAAARFRSRHSISSLAGAVARFLPT